MRKRCSEHLSDEPPKKRISPGGNILPTQIPIDEILTDLTGKQWRLGRSIGYGGFGDIYLASDNIKDHVNNNATYVVKVESHSNGPLFVEINCLLRIARQDMIHNWKKDHKYASFGMPHYVASGSHIINNEKLRFLVLPRYEQDLEKTFLEKNKKFNLKTVILICTQVLDVLEYIHSKGYVHCDIKASNILHSLQPCTEEKIELSCREYYPIRLCRYRKPLYFPQHCRRNLRYKKRLNYNENLLNEDIDSIIDEKPNFNNYQLNQIVVIDYGLATKYRHPNGIHKQYCNDERKAHAGTILFCSIDAHLGASSRRSDLESLGYNMIYWLSSKLPWIDDVGYPEVVQQKKEIGLRNINNFLKSCFTHHEYPVFLYEYFQYVKSLTFESKPDYEYCRKLLKTALEEYGYKNDGCFDFDNLEGWGKQPRFFVENVTVKSENMNLRPKEKSNRIPLASNILLDKPSLRKKPDREVRKKKLNWSKLLTVDPEEILRQNNKSKSTQEGRERKITDSSDSSCGSNSLQYLDIFSLNPTYAMLNIFNKCKNKNANYNGLPKHGKGESNGLKHRKGYTPAMDLVLTRMNQRRLEELENETENNYMSISARLTRRTKINDKKKIQKVTTGSFIAIKEVCKRKQLRPIRNQGNGLL